MGIRVEHLNKRYGDFSLQDVSFTVPAGTILGLIGENGAGKSTTIRAMLGLLTPDSGTVTYSGQPLTQALREEIGVVYDFLPVDGGLNAHQFGRILSDSFHTWDNDLWQRYLERFTLPQKKELSTFSRGMKMKLAIAAALAHHPRYLILDEATGGLDPVMRDDLLDVFLEFVGDERHSILMSSHITTDLERVADHITFLHQGRVLLCRPKDELRYGYGILRCREAELAGLDPADMLAIRREECQCSVLVADKEEARRRYPALVVDDTSLEEMMRIMVKGECRL